MTAITHVDEEIVQRFRSPVAAELTSHCVARAMADVLVEHADGDGLERLGGCADLGEDIDALGVFALHWWHPGPRFVAPPSAPDRDIREPV